MASLRIAIRPVIGASSRHIKQRVHFSSGSRIRQELQQQQARPKVRTDGPLYTYVPQPIDYTDSVTIPIDGQPHSFDSVFLRDACTCAACVDVSSSQKNFQTCDIPADIQGSFQGTSTTQNGIESAVIRWNSDVRDFKDHQSLIPIDLLRKTAKGDLRTHISHFQAKNRVFWNREVMSRDNFFIEYDNYISSDQTLFKTLKQIESHGLVFLQNVPDCSTTDSAASLTKITNRIGPLRSTFYGNTWDVKSVPKAINVAYTHVFLGLHMDLCYLDLTPQYQLLHSLHAKAPGGESLFADSFLAADTLRRQSPELFQSLVSFPVTYHYYNDSKSYRQIRYTVELTDPTDLNSPIKNINWSPPFQGPFALNTDPKELRQFLKAIQAFDALVNAEENLFELRMKEGECVVFDNRRVLHARRAFDPTKGERWLKGAYLDRDVMASRLVRLEENYG